MELNESRWLELDHAQKGEVDIRTLLRHIGEMSAWDVEGDSENAPWVVLQQAVYDSGNVREAAYAVTAHLVAISERRRPEERVVAMELILDIALGRLPLSRPIPVDLLGGYCESIRAWGTLAKETAKVLKLRLGSARILVCAALLGSSRVRAADLLYRVNLNALEVECPKCHDVLNVHVGLDDVQVGPYGGVTAKLIGVAAARSPAVREILVSADDLGTAKMIGPLALLDAMYECPRCAEPLTPTSAVRPALREAFECVGAPAVENEPAGGAT